MINIEEISIRPASIDDLEFITSLVPRLTEFGPPSWRDKESMTNVDSKILTDKIINQPEDTAIFVACSGEEKFGFIHVHSSHDYYNSEKHGHISDIIVSREGEGKGIASMLMKKAEDWAASLGYKWLTLSVFADNTRAREIYEKLGYGADIVKYVKPL